MSHRLRRLSPGIESLPKGLSVALLASVAVLTLILVGCGGSQGTRTQPDQKPAAEAAPPTDPRVVEVASHFQCPCGSCDHMDLVECTCKEPHGATEIKAVIVALRDSGMTAEKTIAQVAAQYGGLKPEGTTPHQPKATQPNTLPSH